MAAQEQFALLMVLLFVGSVGWGDVALACCDRLLPRQPHLDLLIKEEFGLALRAAIGIAVFLAVGGIAVAAEVAYLPFLYGWFVLGALVAIGRRLRHSRFRFHQSVTAGPLLRSVVLVVISLFVASVAYGHAIDGPYNANDDDAAYLYLAQRLLSTGGLIDPFNMRRVSSYGGAELFQALVLGTSGNSSGLAIEWFFFALLTTGIVVRTMRRRGAALAIAVVGLVLLLGQPVGIWANVAPTYSGVVLFVALLQLLALARRDHSARLYGFAGLFVAGLLSLRLEFALPAGVALVLSALTEPHARERVRALGAGAGIGAIAIIGWAIALEASSRTLLFPLEPGNWNTAFPWANPAISSLTTRLEFLRGELATDRLALELGATLLVAIGILLLRRRLSVLDRVASGAVVVVFAIIGCLVEVIVETGSLSGGTFADIGRYDAPNALACVLVALDLIWQTATRVPAPAGDEVASVERHNRLVLALGALTGLVVLFASIGEPLGVYRAALPVDLRATQSVLVGTSGFGDRWASIRPMYKKLNALITPGDHLLAAVDQPGLLDAKRYQFATLDIVGAASPAPHIPIFSGGRAVITYLQRLGYHGIVASVSDAPGLYSFASWQANEQSGIPDYRVMARYFISWDKDLSEIRHDPNVTARRIDTLVLFTW